MFEGGPGAVEVLLRFSYSDFNGGTLQGGTFWRLTPMVNWHLADFLRLELIYGYGRLDRFDLEGNDPIFPEPSSVGVLTARQTHATFRPTC